MRVNAVPCSNILAYLSADRRSILGSFKFATLRSCTYMKGSKRVLTM